MGQTRGKIHSLGRFLQTKVPTLAEGSQVAYYLGVARRPEAPAWAWAILAQQRGVATPRAATTPLQ